MMLNRVIKRYVAPPVFRGDEEKTRLAGLLNTILLVLLVLAVIYGLFVLVLYSNLRITFLFSLGTVPLWLAGLFLIRSGYIRLTAKMVSVALWLIITLAVIGFGGIYAASFNAYVLTILVAGLLLGDRAGLGFALMAILAGSVILLAELNGLLPNPVEFTSPVTHFSVQVLIFIFSGILLYLAVHSLDQAHERVRHQERALAESNRKLAARTRELEYQKETVKASEERFKAIFDNATLGIGLVDQSGCYTQVNDRWAEMLGYTSEELYRMTHLEVSHPDDVAISYDQLQSLIRGETEAYRLEKRFVRKDGTLFWGDLSVSPIYDQAGNIEAIIGMIVDISERKQAEQELRLFKTIVESSQEAIAVSNPEGQLVYINPAHEKLFGYASEEAEQLNFRDYYPPESIESLNREVFPALARGETWEGVLDVFDAGGRRFPLWERADSIRDTDGEMLFAFGLMHDVTDEVEAEKALRESEQRYRALFEGAGDAILLLREARFVDCNVRAEQMFGCPREEIIGKSPHQLSPPSQPDGHDSREKALKLIETGRRGNPITFEWQHRRYDDGSLFDAEITLTSFIFSGQQHLLATGRDITQRKRTEIEREQFTLQLSTAAEIAGQVGAILDPDILLNVVIPLVKERFNLYHVHLYLLDQKARMLNLRAGYGEPGQKMLAAGHNIPLDQEQSLVAQAARTREIVHVPNVAEDPRFLPNPLLPHTRTEVAVPLIAGEQVLGVFDIQHNEMDYFSRSHLDVFRTLAGQIAIALQNATFVEQIERSLTETRVRFEVSQALAGAQTEGEVLDVLIREAGLYPRARVSIQLLDRNAADERTFVVRRSASFGSGLTGSPERSRYSVSKFPLLRLLTPNRPFVSPHIQSDERADSSSRELARQMGISSLAIVPLTAGTEWLGAIMVTSPEEEYFDERKLDLYHTLAGQGAVALQSARLRQSLQESEAKYSAVVEQATDGVVIIQDQILKFLNRAMAETLGYGPNDIQNKPFLAYVAPQSRPFIAARIKARLAGEEVPSVYEARLLRKDGIVLDVEISAGIIQFQGKPANLGIVRDITQRKQTEQEIRRRNRELSLLNRIIAASAVSSDPQEVLELACRELGRALDVPYVAVAWLNESKKSATIIAEYRVEGHPSALNRQLSVIDNPAIHYLVTHRAPLVVDDIRQDPRLAPILNRLQARGIASLLTLPFIIQEQVVGILGLGGLTPRAFSNEAINLAWSVTDQVTGVLARLHLDKERRQLSAAIEQTAESVFITDTEGTILYVNPAFEQISGYSRAEAVGQTPAILKSGKQNRAFYRDLWETISAGQVWHGRFVNKKKDGSFCTEDATITPVRDEQGKIVNYVSVQRDVTRELELEEQYHQAQKMEAVGQLAAGIAHDFNNLLTAINGFTELIQNEMAPDDPRRELTSKVLNTGQRAADLVRQLLTFSRKQIAEPQLLSLNSVVSNMDQMLQPLIGDHIELKTVLAENLWPIKADPSQMEQVIVNLVINARDAMPQGGQLTIETANVVLDEAGAADHLEAKPGNYVLLSVSDTGIGMDEEVKTRLFEPFFTTKEMGKGTGLGLATVFGIVKQGGGYIRVDSQPDQGATFKIYLPQVAKSPRLGSPLDQAGSLPRGTETILLVEDEPLVRELTARILRQQGYAVLEAANGQDAWTMARSHGQTIDLLLTDLVMPKMGGEALTTRLRSLYPNLKVLFTSGYTNHESMYEVEPESDTFYIQKPFSPLELAWKVREVLDREQ